jgi:hypothetical protein
MKAGIVLGYGIFVEPNPEYKKYFEYAVGILNDTQCDVVVTTGGCSNKDFPQKSEAKTISEVLCEIDPKLKPKILLEEEALSTPQNIQFCARLLAQQSKHKVSGIVLIGDSIRIPKAAFLSMTYLSPILGVTLSVKERIKRLSGLYLEEKTDLLKQIRFSAGGVDVFGYPLSNKPYMYANQILSSMLEVFSPEFPDLHEEFIRWRKNKWGLK